MGRLVSLTLGTLWGALAIVLVLFFVGMYFYFTQVAEVNPFTGEHPDPEQRNLDQPAGGDSLPEQPSNEIAAEDVVQNDAQTGGDKSGEATSGAVTCQTEQISYGLKNYIRNQTCLASSGETCTSASYYCGLDIVNIDTNVGGEFGIDFILRVNGEAGDSQTVTQEIGAGETVTFSNTFFVEGSDASAVLDCTTALVAVPTKETCN